MSTVECLRQHMCTRKAKTCINAPLIKRTSELTTISSMSCSYWRMIHPRSTGCGPAGLESDRLDNPSWTPIQPLQELNTVSVKNLEKKLKMLGTIEKTLPRLLASTITWKWIMVTTTMTLEVPTTTTMTPPLPRKSSPPAPCPLNSNN
eukprot:PhF_6_TR26288/c0_g1_i1/m.37674